MVSGQIAFSVLMTKQGLVFPNQVGSPAAAGADGHSSIQMTFDRGHLFTSVVDDHEKFERIANEIGLVA